MASESLEIKVARIEQKIDDFLAINKNGCPTVRSVKAAGILALTGAISWMGFLHIKIDKMSDILSQLVGASDVVMK